MSQLIPFEQRLVGDTRIETVDARDVHAFLGISKDFTSWMKAQIKRAHLVENRDIVLFTQKGEYGNRPTKEYFLTFEAAKHVAMMSGSAKGYEIREYFIACEKALREAPATRGDLLVEMAEAYRRQERKILALETEQAGQKDLLIATQQQAIAALEMGNLALRGQQWLTIRQYVFLYKTDLHAGIFPSTVQKAYARYLRQYCFEHAIPTYTALTVDVAWPDEKTYPMQTIAETLGPWLQRQQGPHLFAVLPDEDVV
jgi:phage anti-repressor protein